MKRYLQLIPLSVVVLLIHACGNADGKNNARENIELTQTNLKSSFEKNIIPIFEKSCGISCHGVKKDAYEEFLSQDPINQRAFYFPYDSRTGKILKKDIPLVYKTAVGHDRVDYSEDPRYSHLLRAPLAEEFGGLPHRGLDVFYSTDDADYQALESWLHHEINAHKKVKETLPENIAYFKHNVLGVMQRNGCFLSSCHGSNVFNDLKLVAPLPIDTSRESTKSDNGFSRSMVLENRDVVLGKVARFANLGGDLSKSRLITKNLPIAEGGIHQRGGNIQFFESLADQDVQFILNWLRLERGVLANQLTSENEKIAESDLGKIKGLVFIRGPRHTPRKWFSFDEFYPGSDIFLLPLQEGENLATASATAINITQSFHDKPVEIQALDVRYDAKRIIFSMRTAVDRGFRLYELQLDKNMSTVLGKPQQISFDKSTLPDGTLIHHIDPLYMPGPVDRSGHELGEIAVKFASNAAGHYVHSDAWAIVGEADSAIETSLFDKQRPEAKGTFTGRRMYFIDGTNKGQWRTIVEHKAIGNSGHEDGSGAHFVLDRSLPNKVDRNTIYAIEKTRGLLQSSYDIWRFIPQSVDIKSTHGSDSLAGLKAKQRFEKSAVQMTYSHAQERRPTARTTGETMFTSVRNLGYQGGKPVFNGAIYRMQAGGFDYHIQGGNRSKYPLYSDSREMGNGLEVRLAHDPRNLWGGGLLSLADHGFGINVETDNPMDNSVYSEDDDSTDIQFSSPPRFIPAQVNFFEEFGDQAVTHTGVSPGGSVRDPYPLLNGSVLVSHTPNKLDHLDSEADPDWDLYVFAFDGSPHTERGDKAGVFHREKITAASSALAEYSPRPLMLRLKENPSAPIHHQKFGSRSQKTPPKEELGVLRMPEGLAAEIECYDYPLLQTFLTNFAPVGSKDLRLQHDNPNGVVTPEERLFKYVRVVMQVPNSKDDLTAIYQEEQEGDPFASAVSLGIHNKRVIVAELPIEDDGSFFVEVPSNVPLIIQGLNSEKMAMHSMNRWVYLQPGEKLTFAIPRTIYPLRCAGCHGALTGNPTDGIGPADLVSASSRVMATWNFSEGKRRAAYGFDKKKEQYIAIDFRNDVQPILNKRCTSCHNTKNSPGRLDLRDAPTQHYNVAYESLLQLSDPASGNYAKKKYINEREALSSESRLIQSLAGKQGQNHLQNQTLSKQELLTLIRWVDLGATFLGGRDLNDTTRLEASTLKTTTNAKSDKLDDNIFAKYSATKENSVTNENIVTQENAATEENTLAKENSTTKEYIAIKEINQPDQKNVTKETM